jgi:TatA/E family protein of Tat protein translocase
MGPFGVQEMMVIFILALLLFGPKKLPELARLLGKGLTEFRRAKNELKTTFDTHMRELEREAQLEELKNKPATPAATYNPYSYMADEYGKVSSDYSPAEPPVVSHAEPEPPSLPPATPVVGSIPRSLGTSTPEPATIRTSSPAHDEHSAA